MKNDQTTKMNFGTAAVHVGQEPDQSFGAVIPPISISSTFAQQGIGIYKGYDYSRAGNPTRDNLERCIAALEGGTRGLAFASGLAAETAILDLLPKDSHIIALDDLYGGTYRLFERVRKRTTGLSVTYLDFLDYKKVEEAITSQTKMIWIETPSNPLLKLVDLAQIAELGKKHNLITVCDNTFASPYLQQPLKFGFDLVFHSATKYLNGHSDVIGGVIAIGEQRDPNRDLGEELYFLQKSCGGVPSPFDCYLVQRGIKTLHLRMERHCDNAMQLAESLEGHAAIEKVIYPGLKSHPQHALASTQMKHFGGIISIILKGGLPAAEKLLTQTRLFTLAESLGGVESLIQHPALMTHASIPPEERKRIGLVDGLVRISVGIEDVEDLKADLLDALK
jgi:cystathionine gamma-lyase